MEDLRAIVPCLSTASEVPVIGALKLAWLVEQSTFDQQVEGSNPLRLFLIVAVVERQSVVNFRHNFCAYLSMFNAD